jgi:hypothetical protein
VTNTTDKVISMEDFNQSRKEATNLTATDKADNMIQQELEDADEIAANILGVCEDCGDPLNSLGTIQFLIMNLVCGLNEIGVTDEEIHDLVDTAIETPRYL